MSGHCADIYLQGYMSALYPSSIFSSRVEYMYIITFIVCPFINGGPQLPQPAALACYIGRQNHRPAFRR